MEIRLQEIKNGGRKIKTFFLAILDGLGTPCPIQCRVMLTHFMTCIPLASITSKKTEKKRSRKTRKKYKTLQMNLIVFSKPSQMLLLRFQPENPSQEKKVSG